MVTLEGAGNPLSVGDNSTGDPQYGGPSLVQAAPSCICFPGQPLPLPFFICSCVSLSCLGLGAETLTAQGLALRGAAGMLDQ